MTIPDLPHAPSLPLGGSGPSSAEGKDPPTKLREVVDLATGRVHPEDPVTPGSGGPAGNAQLTAWLGLTLLVLFVGQLVTLLDVRGLISWHLTIGLLLIPPALAKTATTGWRMVRYYTGARAYRQAGPPPLLLRVLGPLVILSTLSLLGTGVAVLAAGPVLDSRPLVTVLRQPISTLTLHQASTAAWLMLISAHVLARFLPAIHLATTSTRDGLRLPGRGRRTTVLVATLTLAVLVAVAGAALAGAWTIGK